MKQYSIHNETGRFVAIDEINQLDVSSDSYDVKITRIRSPRRHRRFMAMVRDALKRTGDKRNFRDFRKAVTFDAGFYELMVSLKGEPFAEAKSLAYDEMDDLEFHEVHSKVLDVLIQHPDLSDEDQMSLIQNYNVAPVEDSSNAQ